MSASEFRRCLIESDVAGAQSLWAKANPGLPRLDADQAITSLHMARIEAKSMPRSLKAYSLAWLAERGFSMVDGQWVCGPVKRDGIAEAVGVASMSTDPHFSNRIVRAMNDALLNGMAKGITEPVMQRELMMAARAKQRFRERRI
jgi:hypothetical protein